LHTAFVKKLILLFDEYLYSHDKDKLIIDQGKLKAKNQV